MLNKLYKINYVRNIFIKNEPVCMGKTNERMKINERTRETKVKPVILEIFSFFAVSLGDENLYWVKERFNDTIKC